MTDSAARPITPAHLLCVYAEPLVSGRRVAVIGDASAGLGERLLDLGARGVHVFDDDARRATQAAPTRGVTTRALESDLGVRDGAFDLALIPDLASLRDPAGVLARLRRALGAEGVLIAATANAAEGRGAEDGPHLDYYELYDLVSLQFAQVRMVGQVPFVGVALADLGETEGDPTVSVQTQLVEESAAPERFVAVASQDDVALDGYVIVQVPPHGAAAHAGAWERDHEADEADAALLAEARLRAELLATQLEDTNARLKRSAVETAAHEERSRRTLDLETELMEAQARLEVRAAEAAEMKAKLRQLEGLAEGYAVAEGLRVRVRDLELELEHARQRLALLEGAARAAEEAAAELEERADELSRLVIARTEEAAVLLAEVATLREAQTAAVVVPMADPAVLEELTARAAMLEARALEIERRAAAYERELGQVHDANAAELDEAERRLRERSQALAEAERELRRRERMVHDLLAAAEEAKREVVAPSSAPKSEAVFFPEPPAVSDDELARENASLRAKLDALALEVARREGELETRAWRIVELEEAVARAAAPKTAPEGRRPPTSASDEGPLRAELDRAKDELDMLRKALAQEHEARVRAESSEELEKARAEIERQASLLEKLSGELDARDRRSTATES